jgi:hypothetical protein
VHLVEKAGAGDFDRAFRFQVKNKLNRKANRGIRFQNRDIIAGPQRRGRKKRANQQHYAQKRREKTPRHFSFPNRECR